MSTIQNSFYLSNYLNLDIEKSNNALFYYMFYVNYFRNYSWGLVFKIEKKLYKIIIKNVQF